MKYRSLTHIECTRSVWVTLIYHPKYNFSGVNSLQDMLQNRWTTKYRSLTYMYLRGQSDVSHWTIIHTMMLIHLIIKKILSKITRQWNIGHADLYLLWDQSFSHTVSLYVNITLRHQTLEEIRQNHRAMKYRSHNPKLWIIHQVVLKM